MKANGNPNTPDELNPYVQQVLDILNMKKEKLQNVDGDYRDQIDSILKDNPKARENKKLALYLINEVGVKYFYKFDKFKDDKDVALAALAQDSGIFRVLKPQFQMQPLFAQEALKSFVREKTSFVEIEKFLTQYFPDAGAFKKLFGFYKKYLRIADYIFHSDIERQLIDIREKNQEFYNLLFSKKLLKQNGKKTEISPEFHTFFLGEISSIANFAELSAEEKEAVYISLFQKYLQIGNTHMSEEMKVFFQILSSLMHVKQEKKNKKAPDEDSSEEDLGDDDEDPDDETILEDRLEFCLPQCHYSISSDGGCDIKLGHDTHMYLSKAEMSRINNIALQNYVEGVKKLQEAGLGFALSYQERFFNLCGVNHLSGEGLTDGMVLRILNKVGNKLEMPKKVHTSINQQGDEVKNEEIKCFHTLSEAMHRYREVAASGEIYGNFVCDPSKRGTRSIVEIALSQKGYYDSQGKGFQRIEDWYL